MTLIRRKSYTYPGHIRDFFNVFLSKNWQEGPYVKQLEDEFSKLVKVNHATCTSFGLHALTIILNYFHFNQDTELLIPGYTAKVVPQCLIELNIPFRCIDIDPFRATMDPKDFEKKITSKTKGVLLTHLLGNSCNEEILSIAKKYKLIIIEDCAHAHGAQINNTFLGSLADASFFSFGYSKLVNTYTGGILLTNNPELHQYAKNDIRRRPTLKRIQLLRKFIMGHAENIAGIPLLTSLLRPILRSNYFLKKTKNIINFFTRKKLTHFYQYTNTQALIGLKQLQNLEFMLENKKQKADYIISKTKINYLRRQPGDVYYNFIADVSDAKEYHQFLLNLGVDTGCNNNIMEVISPTENLPGCAYANKHYLLLPNYESLNQNQLDKIASAINTAFAILK